MSWDDGLTVTENRGFRGLDAEHLDWMWTTSHAGHYQPLSWMTLAADFERLGLTPPDHPEAPGFHRTSIALHAAGALALYFLCFSVLSLACAARGQAPARLHLAAAAAFAALVHAVHPLRCESVCWVTERRDVLSGVFFVLAVLTYLRAAPAPGASRLGNGPLALGAAAGLGALALFFVSLSFEDSSRLTVRGPGAIGIAGALLLLGVSAVATARADPERRVGWALLCVPLVALSLLAKAWGIVMPALLLVLDAWPLRRVSGVRSGLALVVEKAPFIALSVAFAGLARWAQTAQQGSVDFWQVHGLSERVVQALYGLAFYPAKTLVPTGLVPLYPIPETLGWLEPRFLVAAIASIGITVVLVARARRNPGWLAAWVAYAVIVSPVLGVQQTGPQLVADRYAYLAGIPLALLAGGALLAALGHAGGAARAGLAVAIAIVLLLLFASWRQSAVWHSSETLWTHARSAGPPTAMGALNLGIVRAQQARSSADPTQRAELRREALALFDEGVRLRPSYELFAINSAIVLAEQAVALPQSERDAALARADDLADGAIRAAESKGVHDAAYYLHHGRILMAQRRVQAAGRRFERAVELRPEWPEARVNLGSALLESGRQLGERDPEGGLVLVEQSIIQLGRARNAEPGAAALLRAMAFDVEWRLLAHLGRRAEAAASRTRARDAYASIPAQDPTHAEARARLRDLDEASPAPMDVSP